MCCSPGIRQQFGDMTLSKRCPCPLAFTNHSSGTPFATEHVLLNLWNFQFLSFLALWKLFPRNPPVVLPLHTILPPQTGSPSCPYPFTPPPTCLLLWCCFWHPSAMSLCPSGPPWAWLYAHSPEMPSLLSLTRFFNSTVLCLYSHFAITHCLLIMWAILFIF